MPVYIFCLEPEKKLFEKIKYLKEEVIALVGDQTYLQDPPHLTIYLGDINLPQEDIVKKFQDRKIRPLSILIEGKQIFGEDPVTGKKTFTYAVRQTPELIGLQTSIYTSVKNHLSKKLLNRYKNLSNETLVKNSVDYGYPFFGEVWNPHISIASFGEKDFEKAACLLSNEEILGEFNVRSFVIYSLDENTDQITEIWRKNL